MPENFRDTLFEAYIRDFSAQLIRIVGILTVFLLLSSFLFTELVGEYFDPYIDQRFDLYYEWRLILCGVLLWMVLGLTVSDWFQKYLNLFFAISFAASAFLTSYYIMPIKRPNTTLRYLVYIIPFFTIITPARLKQRTIITLSSLVIVPGAYLALGPQAYFYTPLFVIITGISLVSVTIGHFCFYRLTRKNFFQNRRLKRQSEELRRAKIKAEEANHKKNLFLANVTHDLRTPLSAIKSYAELLLGEASSSTHIRKLKTIISAAKDLSKLIDTLLDLSEVQLDDSELDRDLVSLPELFRNLRNFYSREIRDKKVSLKLQSDDDMPDRIEISETALKQIVFNLVDNAFKHTRSGSVTVDFQSAEAESGVIDLTITVEDTGSGMHKDQLEQVFNLLDQGGRDGEVSKEGFGLGLFICRELVNRMRGEISVSSEPGEGSTFTVILPDVPVARSQNTSEELKESSVSDPGTSRYTDDLSINVKELPDEVMRTLRDTSRDARRTGEFETIDRLADILETVGRENDLQELIAAGRQLESLLEDRSFTRLNQFIRDLEEQFQEQ